MISILIPIYNVDVTELVNELNQQANSLSSEIEIICIDDCSSNNEVKSNNQNLKNLEIVSYTELSKNIGRGAIRMKLAESAKYKTLLFLDCDMRIPAKDYLQKFVRHIDKKVVVGGITYSSTPPTNPEFMLRWKYGIEREKKSASERNRMRFSHFVASNLLIQKKLFLSLPVDNDITGYGHEDTLLGLKLLNLKTPISHIDNPLEHLGLDTAETFLEKSKTGTENLAKLYAKRICGKEIRLINVYEQLKAWGLLGITLIIISLLLPLFERNLESKQPKMRYFDFWKLYYFVKNYEALNKSR